MGFGFKSGFCNLLWLKYCNHIINDSIYKKDDKKNMLQWANYFYA